MKSGILQILYAHPFSGLDHEYPFQHLTNFCQLAGTDGADEEKEEAVFMRLFPHSLIGKAKEWYLDQSTLVMTDWNTLENSFQERFYPVDRHMEAKTTVAMFAQGASESLCEAWERYMSLLRKCPKYGFDGTSQIHIFQPRTSTAIQTSVG